MLVKTCLQHYGCDMYLQPIPLAGSFCFWFVKKYCWLVCVREKYYSGWKFTIVYDKPQPNEQAEWIRSAYSTCWCLLFVTVPQEISSPHIRLIDLCKYWSITSKQETIIYIYAVYKYTWPKKEYKSAGTFSCTFAAGSPFPV